MKIVIILSFFVFSLTSLAQTDNIYKDAVTVIVNSDEYKSLAKSQRKYYVSDQLIIFSKMGKMFIDELAQYNVELSDYDIIMGDKKKNLKNTDLLNLNKKKCSKLKIYFSEEKEGIFFTELIKESKKQTIYDKRIHFGISYMFMFKKVGENEVELIEVKVIHYN